MSAKYTFSCPVACKVPYEDRYETYDDLGVLMLPDSYSETGEPTRLVISCHGAGGSVNTDDAQICNQTYSKYLLANGFAVMDMAGLPLEFCEKYGVDYYNNIGCPIATDSYVAGYRKCISEYNLKKEVLIHGGSMGGISSTNLVLSGRIPVLVQSGFCPVLDAYQEIFLHPWSDGLPKIALQKLYSLPGPEYDAQRVGLNNPMANPKIRHYPVSIDFWQCADDPVVSIAVTKQFVDEVNAGGGHAVLHTLPAGGHEPQLYGEYLLHPSGNTDFSGEQLQITEAVEGAFCVAIQYR